MSLAQHVRGWTGGIGVWRKLAIALAAAALASGIATYLALTGAPPFRPLSQNACSKCGRSDAAISRARGFRCASSVCSA